MWGSKALSFADIIALLFTVLAAWFYSEFGALKIKLKNEKDLLNNTITSNETFLIFNRVPKAGTESLMELLHFLAQMNNYTAAQDDGELKAKRGENPWLPLEKDRKNYIEMLENPPLDNHSYPLSYVKHVNFLNFEEFGRKNPIYINMVRHPVERIISWYYYIRQNWYQLKGDKNDPDKFELKNDLSPTFFKYTYEECFNEKLDECTYAVDGSTHGRAGGSHMSQIAFFCGMSPECDIFGSEAGLKLAKSNVEKYYSVVGILEKWNESLEVMEHYIPRFFTNVTTAYKLYMQDKPKNKNNIKAKVSKKIKDLVAANFTVEIDFYEFCKQRFYKQYLAMK